jgi:hypothetical protein
MVSSTCCIKNDFLIKNYYNNINNNIIINNSIIKKYNKIHLKILKYIYYGEYQ